ncbi:MAG: acyl-CoA thioesterase [Acidimicrobiaceae bacterium]|nr:acyl-CoA thioesterase [Acidimicrobiaceae bacterium]
MNEASRDDIDFHTRRWVRREDLNAHGTLFGGSLLRWIDEEATIYSIVQLDNHHVVTKYMSEIDFVISARKGDVIEMGLRASAFVRTSITMRAEVRNMITHKTILRIERVVFVTLDADGTLVTQGHHDITLDRDRPFEVSST